VTVFTRSMLNAGKCNDPNCSNPECSERLFFGNRCHEDAGFDAVYVKACGHLNLLCSECGETIVVIAVGEGFVCN